MSPLLQTFANGSALGYRSLSAAAATSFESIATVSVGSGGTGSITFSSIPSTFTHLQIRAIYNTEVQGENIGMTLNTSITSTRVHYLSGNGTSASAGSETTNLFTLQAGFDTQKMYGVVVDILDYANTNKNKTIRTLGGIDTNGGGVIFMSSNLYSTTSAITTIKLAPLSAIDFQQYSHFALYGIKSA